MVVYTPFYAKILKVMAIEKDTKQKIIGKFATSTKDTGSPEVQIALLSERIETLSKHLQIHKKDDHSRRGLLRMVGTRRKLLSYLKKNKEESYLKILKSLNLKK